MELRNVHVEGNAADRDQELRALRAQNKEFKAMLDNVNNNVGLSYFISALVCVQMQPNMCVCVCCLILYVL